MHKEEELDITAFCSYLQKRISGFTAIKQVSQLPKGSSNLNYLLKTNLGEWVLRRPPQQGACIQNGHDISYEYRLLSKIQDIYGRAPRLIHFCTDESVMGCPFFIMERTEGITLCKKTPELLSLSPKK